MNPIWIALLSIVAIVVIYKVVVYCIALTKPSPAVRVGPDQLSLSIQNTQVIPQDQFEKAWNGTDGSSLLFFVYPLVNDRSSSASSDYSTIFSVGSMLSLKLLVTPDAGRGYSRAPAQLGIEVACQTNSPCSDTVDLPEIPLQRWTAIAIVRQGRKFNIYYNGKLSTSHLCTATPTYIKSTPLTIGDPKLGGTMALMSIASYPLQANDVRTLVAGLVDVTGAPYLSSGISLPIPTMSDIEKMLTCPFGNCEAVGSPGPLQSWSSPYA